MSYQFPSDIDAVVRHQIAAGYFESEDDVLRFALGQLATEEEDVRAIQEAIDMLETGEEGRPLAEVAEELRIKYGIAADA